MVYDGHVKNGVVVFESAAPPEGTVVRVEAADHPPAQPESIWEKMSKMAGRAPDLPQDAARNHDHYLYGTLKR